MEKCVNTAHQVIIQCITVDPNLVKWLLDARCSGEIN